MLSATGEVERRASAEAGVDESATASEDEAVGDGDNDLADVTAARCRRPWKRLEPIGRPWIVGTCAAERAPLEASSKSRSASSFLMFFIKPQFFSLNLYIRSLENDRMMC